VGDDFLSFILIPTPHILTSLSLSRPYILILYPCSGFFLARTRATCTTVFLSIYAHRHSPYFLQFVYSYYSFYYVYSLYSLQILYALHLYILFTFYTICGFYISDTLHTTMPIYLLNSLYSVFWMAFVLLCSVHSLYSLFALYSLNHLRFSRIHMILELSKTNNNPYDLRPGKN
jgi:hypothetical protein